MAAAAAAGVSERSGLALVGAFRAEGERGLLDRSSAAAAGSPRQTAGGDRVEAIAVAAASCG